MNKVVKSTVVYVFVAILGLFLLAKALTATPGREKLNLLEFRKLLDAHQIDTAKLYDRDHLVKGELKDGKKYELKFPDRYTDEITDQVVDAGVSLPVDNQKDSLWLTLLFNFAPFVLIIGVIAFFMNQAQGGGNRVMSFGKARPKIVNKDTPKVTFADVAGVNEAIEELQEIKDFLENPQKFRQMGAKIPKGVLLFGPPGTGKTLLARAVAGEAGVPFFSISGSDFVEMFVGVGASRVRDLFEQAKNSAPAIVFVDEIDAVGRQRGAGLGGGHDEREQTLNQLLVETIGSSAQLMMPWPESIVRQAYALTR